MFIIRLLLIGFIFFLLLNGYYLFRFIFRVRDNLKQFREQAGGYQGGSASGGTGNVKYNQAASQRKKIIPENEGEYVEFEEIDE